MSFKIKGGDRVLVLAPHPDDESLATGALIQRAIEMGAIPRVLFATNGDNNPWPQRWVEKRWLIGRAERRRWGALRRREARAALRRLGVPISSACFLNFPDQGITDLLLRADSDAMARICHEIKEFQPTVIVIPSSFDLHPDHNALFVLFQIALDRLGMSKTRQIHFIVHCRRPDLVPGRMELHLRDDERRVKREAILCHNTQMVLSRKRFVAYAKRVETFFEAAPAREMLKHHRVQEAYIASGALNLVVTFPRGKWEGASLWIAGESLTEGSIRLRLPLPLTSKKVRLRDAITDEELRYATVRVQKEHSIVKIPVANLQPLTRIFVKLHRRTIFLDEAGWREVPIPDAVPAKAELTLTKESIERKLP